MNILQKTNLPPDKRFKGLEDVETLLRKGGPLKAAPKCLILEISSNLASKLVIHTYHPTTGSSI